jgi:predicted GH43/DUF377 family glycosyl hydrolase
VLLRPGAVWAAVWLAGCTAYSEFTLPLERGQAGRVRAVMTDEAQPVMDRGAAGGWDSVDTLNPSVVRFASGLLNVYSGFDGKTWHSGVAVSADGKSWSGRRRVLSPDPKTWEGGYIAANGAAIVWQGRLLYLYQAGDPPRLGLAESTDGQSWTKRAAPVLDPGPVASWDERGVADPYLIDRGGVLYLYYLGQDRARRQRLGVARSGDGVHWSKHRRNPVLEIGQEGAFDENGLGEPAVWAAGGRYWMLYTGRDRHEFRRLGLAHSSDGVRWTRLHEQAVFSGSAAWNSKVVCDPAVEVLPGGAVRVWYGGGDVAHPAENIHGKIGLATLRLVRE